MYKPKDDEKEVKETTEEEVKNKAKETTKKKGKEESKEQPKKEVVQEETAPEEKEAAPEEKETLAVSKEDWKKVNDQIEFLMKQNANLLAAAQSGGVSNASDSEVVIGCYAINGIVLKDQRGMKIPITYGTEISILESDLRNVIQSKAHFWRKFFEKGILYFSNPAHYKKFKLKQDFSLDEDVIQNILSKKTPAELNRYFDEYTDRKKTQSAIHTFLYRVADLYDQEALSKVSYENRAALEKYFSCPLEQARSGLRLLKKSRPR